jgi:hypothetical protein
MFIPFESLPDHSRIWVYQSNRKFNSQEITIISDALLAFTGEWSAHGIPLRSSFDIRFDQFIILAADEISNAASGCSIDDSVRFIKDLGQKLNIDLFDRTLIAFKNHDKVMTIPMAQLKEKYKEGMWNGQTPLINILINKKGDLNTVWFVPAELSWLKRYLGRETVAG